MNQNFINSLIRYQADTQLIRTDLRIEDKATVKNSSFVQKFIFWINGTFNAKKTAEAIDNCVGQYLARDEVSLVSKDLKSLRANLEALNRKFSIRGNKREAQQVLDTTIRRIEVKISHLKEQKRLERAVKKPVTLEKKRVRKQAPLSSTDKIHQSATQQLSKKAETKVAKQKKVKQVAQQVLPPASQAEAVKVATSHPLEIISSSSASSIASPPIPIRLANQLKAVQDRINQMDIHSPTFKRDAGKIRTDLQKIARIYPEFAQNLKNLTELMRILETKGNLAFKPSYLQQKIIDKFNPHYHFDKKAVEQPLNQILDSLRIPIQDSSSKAVAQQLMQKSSGIKREWDQLKNELFERDINLNDKVELKDNVFAFRQALLDVRRRLSHDFQEILNHMKENYSSEKFQDLLSHYPNDNLELNKEELLDEIMDAMADELIGDIDFAAAKIPANKWEETKERLYQSNRERLARFLKNSLDVYDWWNENIDFIKVAYDQGADVHRNQGKGTCMINSFRRYQQFAQQPDISIENLGLGSDETGRIKQARINIGNLFGAENIEGLKKMFREQGINPDTWIVRRHSLQRNSEASYQGLVDDMIRPPEKGKPLVGLLSMSYTDSSKQAQPGHMINIQVSPGIKKFRIIDDNIGAIEFSSVKELKQQLASYLRVFYPEYGSFTMLIP